MDCTNLTKQILYSSLRKLIFVVFWDHALQNFQSDKARRSPFFKFLRFIMASLTGSESVFKTYSKSLSYLSWGVTCAAFSWHDLNELCIKITSIEEVLMFFLWKYIFQINLITFKVNLPIAVLINFINHGIYLFLCATIPRVSISSPSCSKC